ncbi:MULTISPECIES: site-2 protease family protein [unclassified Streptomyces]|uniref:site-2 protease family protein n=1 Tax=unclassified Streptomyces TaxID=2593676 RepID=UPI0008797ABC|nr:MULTISPECIES: site-2 protease family protein [unclassified Streptomyces]REH19934.1 Zn-dependent protease [Streptomyces sp. 2221.1]SDT03454.1 Zn-dependent protease (includes SpoIVFB) [Streptomyces sp. 2114.2]
MDVSGGSGQPRSGNDESAGPQAHPTAQAADPTDSAEPGPTGPKATGPEKHGTEAQGSDAPGSERPGSEMPGSEAPGSERSRSEAPGSDAPGPETPGPETPRPETPGRGTPTPETPDAQAPTPPGPGETTGDAPQTPEAPASPRRPEPAAGPRHAAHGTGAPHHHRAEAHTEGAGGPGKPPQRRPEPGGGLLMGRPFGVPVYVAPSWFLVAVLITWVFGGQLDRVLPELGAARYLVSLFFAVAFYASVLVHELAHTVAALRFKLPVRRIQLQFFGGVSEIEKEAETPGREFVLAFVGPLLSLVLSGVFYAALLPVEPDSVAGVLLAGLMVSNLIVAVFNLLPGLPLDGGRMLRAVVWKLTGKPMSGTIAAAWVGRALAIAVLIGLPLLTQSLGSDAADDVGMDTVMDALLAAILAAIIWTGAGNSLRMARLREHLPELRARALTRRAVPVQADTPLSEALRRANASGARALVVVDGEGTPASLVREAAIVGVPEHRRPWVPVSTLAQDLTDGMRVSAELSGEELLDALRANPATEYLVVEETGEIYGVLSAADVERAFVKAMARPS